jgi:hypothetical protein
MEKKRDYTELVVWKKAHEVVLYVYQITKIFPREEVLGLLKINTGHKRTIRAKKM